MNSYNPRSVKRPLLRAIIGVGCVLMLAAAGVPRELGDRDASISKVQRVGNTPQRPASKPLGSWLMQNYRFANPGSVSEVQSIDPVLSQLQQIQSMLLAILRKTDFAKDYEPALAAAAQAAANAQLIASRVEYLQSSKAEQCALTAMSSPIYLIASRDKTIDLATSYWVEGLMLNYIAVQGEHVIVRLDLLDIPLSKELNRQHGVAFIVPAGIR